MKNYQRCSLNCLLLLIALFVVTSCASQSSLLYEPAPYDQVAESHNISMEEAKEMDLQHLRPEVRHFIDSTSAVIPGYGGLLSVAANGLLSIGAVWLSRRKKTSDKVAASLVQGIDTFRTVLESTPQGAELDGQLTKVLSRQQSALQVEAEIHKLLQRYANTPQSRSAAEG